MTLHTDLGNIKVLQHSCEMDFFSFYITYDCCLPLQLEVFCDVVPRTAEVYGLSKRTY